MVWYGCTPQQTINSSTEGEWLSCWLHHHHWRCWRLSYWQPSTLPVMMRWSAWQLSISVAPNGPCWLCISLQHKHRPRYDPWPSVIMELTGQHCQRRFIIHFIHYWPGNMNTKTTTYSIPTGNFTMIQRKNCRAEQTLKKDFKTLNPVFFFRSTIQYFWLILKFN